MPIRALLAFDHKRRYESSIYDRGMAGVVAALKCAYLYVQGSDRQYV